MTKFECSNCNYKFESEIDKTSKKCPYCGDGEISKAMSAEELLD